MKVIPKVFRTTYRDSFVLMRMASMIRMMEGVKNAELMQGTEPHAKVPDTFKGGRPCFY